MPAKVFIKTFGCQMNVRDSEVICGLLKQAGFSLTDDPAQAGVILLNTCSVRQNAEQRVWSEIGRYKEGKIVGIVGCMAQEHKEKIFERAQNINFAVGTADIEKIPAIITSLIKDKEGILERKIWETGGAARTDQIYHTGFYQDKKMPLL
jgi:tRNA-2-methylthio-N6-dimethylallyladenosine synthase